MLTGKTVFLVRDGLQDDRDRYGRLLRFVFLKNKSNVNEALVRGGFATYEEQVRLTSDVSGEQHVRRRVERSTRRCRQSVGTVSKNRGPCATSCGGCGQGLPVETWFESLRSYGTSPLVHVLARQLAQLHIVRKIGRDQSWKRTG